MGRVPWIAQAAQCKHKDPGERQEGHSPRDGGDMSSGHGGALCRRTEGLTSPGKKLEEATTWIRPQSPWGDAAPLTP